MSDLNDLTRPVTTDTEPNVLDTLRAHIIRAATWSGYSSTANKVAGLMSSVTAAVLGGRSLRLYRRNDLNTADEEVVSLPGVSIGGSAATLSDSSAYMRELPSILVDDIDAALENGFRSVGYPDPGGGLLQATSLLCWDAGGSTGVVQIEMDFNGSERIRNRVGGIWTAWRYSLTSANIGSYAPGKTGAGASGTWGISITGSANYASSAGTATSATTAGSAATVTTTIGSSAAATTQDPSDRSAKVATTQWVQDAMSSLASAAGFAASFSANGYVKFPSWLGGVVVQWGSTALVNGVLSFPIAFPTACYSVTVSGPNTSSIIASAGTVTTTGFDAYGIYPDVGRSSCPLSYIAIGK